MNMTGDLRYVSAADYAAFTDANSALLRENVYEANKTAIEAAYRQHDPEMTGDAIKQAWLRGHAAGQHRAPHRLGPHGTIGSWVVGNPAIALIDGTLFVHGGISPGLCPPADWPRSTAASPPRSRRKPPIPKAIINDPHGPLWYRGLRCRRAGAGAQPVAPAGAAAARPSSKISLDVLLPAFGAQRIVIGHTPVLSASPSPRAAPDPHRHRHIAVYGGKLS